MQGDVGQDWFLEGIPEKCGQDTYLFASRPFSVSQSIPPEASPKAGRILYLHCSSLFYDPICLKCANLEVLKSVYVYIYIISRCQKSQNVKLLAVSLGEAHRKHTYAQKKQNICLVTHAGYCSYQLFIPAKNPYDFFVTFLFPLSIISMNPDL